ncbi:MAG TPA: NAD(P)-binding domain-containing protein [Thermoanaerobaculia bacterium]|nr:NAD(P)-binding domain-containing protein [Thermoanaerobaculia bacterium]
MKRCVVIGGGPMGLAAALGAVHRGFDVTVLERGRVGESLRGWGDTRFFTPFAMNVGDDVREALGAFRPPDEALLTGPEMADRVLVRLAESAPLAGRVREGCAVVAVGRSGMTRSDFAGHPLRAERPFRLLVESGRGEETIEAEVVLDASGAFTRPNFAGRGGLPAPGERALGGRIVRNLGDLASRREAFAEKTVLLVGHGHSAAHAVLALAEAAKPPAGPIVWAVRSPNLRPCAEAARDPLPERDRVARSANDLAASPPRCLTVRRRTTIAAFASEGERIRIRFAGGEDAVVDEVVALTGYRPDFSHLSELALELSPSTGGPARLSAALGGVADCLSIPSVASSDFATGEPGFFFVGSASYGRNRTFLLRTGLGHLAAVLDSIA